MKLDAVEVFLRCRDLSAALELEADIRKRMALCRRAIGLGREAVGVVEHLTFEQLGQIQTLLQRAYTVSRGMANTGAAMAKLAKGRMAALGLEKLPVAAATRSRIIGTNSASLALSDSALPDNWFEMDAAVQEMNAARYFWCGTGADGGHSLTLRLLDASEPMLEAAEYNRVVEGSPQFVLSVTSGNVWFGAAEHVQQGVSLAVANGRYIGLLVSLRSGRNLRFIATLVRSDAAVPPLHQAFEFREP